MTWRTRPPKLAKGLTLRQREIRRQIDARLLQNEDNYSRRLREKAEERAKQERAAHEAAVPGQAEQARWNGASDQRFDHKFWAEMGLGGPYLDERLYLKRRSEPALNRALLCDDMMLIGFGGLGFVGYRQTQKAKPQAA